MYKKQLINLNFFRNCSIDDIKCFLYYCGASSFKEKDIESLLSLIDNLDCKYLKEFNVSYYIEKLDKEFDLIKLDDSTLINIELKTSTRDIRQCRSNYIILKKEYKDIEIKVFCYEKTSNSIYYYDPMYDDLIKSNFDVLNKSLSIIKKGIKCELDLSIVSVYRYPEYFLDNKYLLSVRQEKIKNSIISSGEKVFLVAGRAGSGKTLLALDIFKYYHNFEGVAVQYLAPIKIFDIINNELINKLNIKTVRDYIKRGIKSDIIVVDESQRLTQDQIKSLIKLANNKIVFFGDTNQNIDYNTSFTDTYESKKYNNLLLKSIIRSDDTIEYYTRKILGLPVSSIKIKSIDKKRIEVRMISSQDEFEPDVLLLEPSKSFHFANCSSECQHKRCKILSEKIMTSKNPYDVIGLESKCVVIYLCNGYYIENDRINAIDKMCYGNLQGQLYSMMTRATEKLILITDNIQMYNYLYSKLDCMYDSYKN